MTDLGGSAGDAGSTEKDATAPAGPALIYRSVGPQNLEPLARGAGNALQVSGSLATFSKALPLVVGVGDALEYDADGDSVVDTLAFIHARQSATRYLLADEQGDPLTRGTASTESWSLFRAYTSLADAAQGTTNPSISMPFDGWSGGRDLVAAKQVWQIACYADAADAGTAMFDAWTSSPDYYLRIFTPVTSSEVGASQRHRGVWDATKYRIEGPSGGRALVLHGVSVRVEGLQLSILNNERADALPYGISLRRLRPGAEAALDNNLIHGDGATSSGAIPRGIFISENDGGTVYARNNIIYGIGGTTFAPGYGINVKWPGVQAVLHNNTVVSTFNAIVVENDARAVLVNNVVMGEGNNIHEAALISGSHNASQDGSAVDLAIGSQLPSAVLVDYFRDSDDLHIDPTATHAGALIDRGLDLSGGGPFPLPTDIDGSPRPVGGWDIGADEVLTE